jgi:hypothetical protein
MIFKIRRTSLQNHRKQKDYIRTYSIEIYRIILMFWQKGHRRQDTSTVHVLNMYMLSRAITLCCQEEKRDNSINPCW